MVDRYLNVFSVAFLCVALTVFVVVFATTPLLCGLGPIVNAPWARSATVLIGTEGDIQIYVSENRRIFLDGTLVPRHILGRELTEIATKTSVERNVVIRANRSVPFSVIQDIVVASRDAGFTQLSLVTFRGTTLEAWRRGGTI